MAVRHGPCLLTLKKDPGFWNKVPEETSPHLLLGAQDQPLGVKQDQLPCGSTWISSCNCQEMATCMVWHVTRHDSLSKTIFQGTLEGGRCCGLRGNTGWTASKSGHPCPCQYCSQGPPAERTGRGSLLNLLLMCLQCSNLSWRWTELNWTLKQSVVPGMIWYYVYTCQRLLTPYCAHVKNNLSLEQNIFKV